MTDFETQALALLTEIRDLLRGRKHNDGPGTTRDLLAMAGDAQGVTTFPNYGRAKLKPIAGADLDDLEYYANGARRSLADPSKARWYTKERALLAAIEAELRRRANGGAPEAPPPRDPPPDFGPPGPLSDDDVPFASFWHRD